MTARHALARIGVLMGAVFVDMMGYLMVLPLLPFYAERLGATPFTIGVLVAAYAFAQLATAPLWGRLSDHWGRRPVILAGLFTSAVAFLLFGLASSLWLLLLSRLVQGGGAGINGVIQAYVSDAVGGADRAKALGWLTAAASAGVMLGPALALFAARLGPQAPGLIAAGLALANVAVAARFLPEPLREAHQGERKKLRHALVDVMRHPATPAHRMIWIYAAGMLAFMAMNGVLALYLGRRFGVTAENIGYFYLYVGAISLVMRGAVLGALVNRWGEVRVLQLGALALTLGLALLTVPSHLALLALVVPLVPVGTAMLFPATTSQLSQHAPRGRLGETLGLQQTFGGVARMVGPIGAGAVFQELGMRWPFWLAAALMALAGSMALGVKRFAGEGEERAATAGDGTETTGKAVVPSSRG